MSLERKDVRCKLDPEWLAALKVICEDDGRDIGEWVEQLITDEITRRHSIARKQCSLAERLDRTGISGNNRESQGRPGSDRDSPGKSGNGGRR